MDKLTKGKQKATDDSLFDPPSNAPPPASKRYQPKQRPRHTGQNPQFAVELQVTAQGRPQKLLTFDFWLIHGPSKETNFVGELERTERNVRMLIVKFGTELGTTEMELETLAVKDNAELTMTFDVKLLGNNKTFNNPEFVRYVPEKGVHLFWSSEAIIHQNEEILKECCLWKRRKDFHFVATVKTADDKTKHGEPWTYKATRIVKDRGKENKLVRLEAQLTDKKETVPDSPIERLDVISRRIGKVIFPGEPNKSR